MCGLSAFAQGSALEGCTAPADLSFRCLLKVGLGLAVYPTLNYSVLLIQPFYWWAYRLMCQYKVFYFLGNSSSCKVPLEHYLIAFCKS